MHCGLCLNACPTYRELGLEMDSPRGRIYQMVQVAEGAPITPSYMEHIGLCLACRGCESACPSGVPYGRMVEDARADRTWQAQAPRGWLARRLRGFVFVAPAGIARRADRGRRRCSISYEASGLKALVRGLGV